MEISNSLIFKIIQHVAGVGDGGVQRQVGQGWHSSLPGQCLPQSHSFVCNTKTSWNNWVIIWDICNQSVFGNDTIIQVYLKCLDNLLQITSCPLKNTMQSRSSNGSAKYSGM